MSNPRFLRSIRLLAQCFQSFERLSAGHLRELGMTPAQFDVVATLGRLEGLSFRELGERTLITKGTLTGVVARLRARGLVECLPHPTDGRSERVRLTPAGEALFAEVFPAHVAHCQRAFVNWRDADFDDLDARLVRLRDALGFPAPAAARPRTARLERP